MICYVTVDTEYDFGFTRSNGHASRQANFSRSIAGRTPSGEFGVRYQMAALDRYGLKAVFFVDPMPALVWGTAAIEDIVGPIVAGGHDVQLHMHTEWLELAGSRNPLGRSMGTNIKDFEYEQQCVLLDFAKGVLVAAGAREPAAFRAGNYGASDDTLRALAVVGLRYDTSHCPGIANSACDIRLTSADQDPVDHCGVVEVPIGCMGGWRGGLRHAQITAVSAAEMHAALQYGHAQGRRSFTIVTHSFELLSRDRSRVNRLVRHRFDSLCRTLAALDGISTGTYRDSPPEAFVGSRHRAAGPLPFNMLRTGARMSEQILGNALYGRR
ncbi:MAG: hypothetical protein EPN36_14835 [Rhodanobacteraceae bacterium]|nr:MAG: hypothetical protein EPN36_14835 [Rhodanobacteraceae bacterium]